MVSLYLRPLLLPEMASQLCFYTSEFLPQLRAIDQDWAPDSRHTGMSYPLPAWNGDSEPVLSPFIKVRTKGEQRQSWGRCNLW